jgi:hypothetical protein
MAANTSPIFILTPNVGTTRISGSNTASDGSGTVYQLLTAGANGTRVDAIRIRNSQITAAASSAMVHKIFYSPTVVTGAPGSGSYKLVAEVATATATRSTTAIGAASIYAFDQPFIMASGSALYACQSVYASAADQFDVQAFSGDY